MQRFIKGRGSKDLSPCVFGFKHLTAPAPPDGARSPPVGAAAAQRSRLDAWADVPQSSRGAMPVSRSVDSQHTVSELTLGETPRGVPLKITPRTRRPWPCRWSSKLRGSHARARSYHRRGRGRGVASRKGSGPVYDKASTRLLRKFNCGTRRAKAVSRAL